MDIVLEGVEGARAGHEHPCRARGTQRAEIAGREVHGVHLRQLVQRQLFVGANRLRARSKRHHRPLAESSTSVTAVLVDLLRSLPRRTPRLIQARHRAPRQAIVAQRRYEG